MVALFVHPSSSHPFLFPVTPFNFSAPHVIPARRCLLSACMCVRVPQEELKCWCHSWKDGAKEKKKKDSSFCCTLFVCLSPVLIVCVFVQPLFMGFCGVMCGLCSAVCDFKYCFSVITFQALLMNRIVSNKRSFHQAESNLFGHKKWQILVPPSWVRVSDTRTNGESLCACLWQT